MSEVETTAMDQIVFSVDALGEAMALLLKVALIVENVF